jgi:hypothetical protein
VYNPRTKAVSRNRQPNEGDSSEEMGEIGVCGPSLTEPEPFECGLECGLLHQTEFVMSLRCDQLQHVCCWAESPHDDEEDDEPGIYPDSWTRLPRF